MYNLNNNNVELDHTLKSCAQTAFFTETVLQPSLGKRNVSAGSSVLPYNNEALLEITKELAVGLNEKWPDERKEFKRAENLL